MTEWIRTENTYPIYPIGKRTLVGRLLQLTVLSAIINKYLVIRLYSLITSCVTPYHHFLGIKLMKFGLIKI